MVNTNKQVTKTLLLYLLQRKSDGQTGRLIQIHVNMQQPIFHSLVIPSGTMKNSRNLHLHTPDCFCNPLAGKRSLEKESDRNVQH